MDDNENSNNNCSFNQSFGKVKPEVEAVNNSEMIQSFISRNLSNNSTKNSNNLEDIIFNEMKEYKKKLYCKPKIEGSNPNTKRDKKSSLYNLETLSENDEKTNITKSGNLLTMNNHSIFKSFNQSNNLQYSPNKNYIPDSEEEMEKEEKEKEEEGKIQNDNKEDESSTVKYQSNNISINQNYISPRISSNQEQVDINNDTNQNNNEKENSIQTYNSQYDLLKNINEPIEKRFSLESNFSKINSILSARNTISYLEKPNYMLLAYSLFRKNYTQYKKIRSNVIYSKGSINKEEQAKIIQKWWRNIKRICDEKLKQIIKIQSVWRGKMSRTYTYVIIYLCYSCERFFDVLSNVLINKVRRLVLNSLLNINYKEYHILTNLQKIFNRYQYIKPYFQKWRCLNKLILFKVDYNKNIILNKRNIDLKELNELNQLEEYYDSKTLKAKNLMENNTLKFLFFKSVFLKLRMNKIRNAFDCLNQYNFNDNFSLKTYSKKSITKGDNDSIKRYFLYKWLNITKNIEINKLKAKLLNYLFNKYSKRSNNNILYKYFSRWKMYAADERIKSEIIINVKMNKKRKLKKSKIIKELIKLSMRFKRKNDTDFARLLIRKWRLLACVRKMTNQNMIIIHKTMKKIYGKLIEDIYDLDKKKEEKFKLINRNEDEDEKEFIEHVSKIYNKKGKSGFKFDKIKK